MSGRLVRVGPWAMLVVLQALDVVTTAVALNTRAAREANATAAAIMSSYGQPVAYGVKVVGVAFLLGALYHYRFRRWAVIGLWAGLVFSAFAVVNNTAFLLSSHP